MTEKLSPTMNTTATVPTSTSISKSQSTMQSEPSVPFWCVNVPREEWEAECPVYLSLVSEKDKRILATPDEEYSRLSWEEARELIGERYFNKTFCLAVLSNN